MSERFLGRFNPIYNRFVNTEESCSSDETKPGFKLPKNLFNKRLKTKIRNTKDFQPSEVYKKTTRFLMPAALLVGALTAPELISKVTGQDSPQLNLALASVDQTPTPTVTPTLVDTRNCSPWPDYIVPVFNNFLTERPGLCLIRSTTQPFSSSDYSNPPSIVLANNIQDPEYEKFIMIFEACNSHHDRVADDAGTRLVSPPAGWWYGSPEGRDFIQRTGWILLSYDTIIKPTPEPGWPWIDLTDGEPAEDASAVCVYRVNDAYHIISGFTEADLSNYPIRDAWGRQYLPGTFTPTPAISLTSTPTETATRTSTPSLTKTPSLTPTPTSIQVTATNTPTVVGVDNFSIIHHGFTNQSEGPGDSFLKR